MLPVAASAPDDPPCQPTLLQSAIQSSLRAVLKHDEQMRRFHELESEARAQKEAEQKAGKALFNVPSTFPPELLHERSRRGDYLRAQFHLLFMPIRPPRDQIIAPAGIGKTREFVTQLRLLTGYTVCCFVPTHDLVQELVPDFQAAGYRCVHPVLGRTAPGMCKLDDIAELSRDIATAGLSVQGVLCGNPENEGGNPENEDDHLCPHFHDCKYQDQRLALGKLSPPADQPLIYVLPSAYLASWP